MPVSFSNKSIMTIVGGYTGPGDIVSGATAWWGLRAYSAATAGTKAVRLIRSSDSSQADIFTLTNGNLNTSDAFFNGSSYKVVTLYDQTGNGLDATQGIDANRLAFVLNVSIGTGLFPVMRGAGSLATGGVAFLTQPNWVSAVVTRTGAFTTAGAWFGETAANMTLIFATTANTVNNYAGTTLSATASDSAWHAIQMVQNGTSSEIYVDGSNTTGDAGTQSIGEPIKLFTDAFGSVFTGDCTEIGLWNHVTPDAGTKSNMNSNQHTYWGGF